MRNTWWTSAAFPGSSTSRKREACSASRPHARVGLEQSELIRVAPILHDTVRVSPIRWCATWRRWAATWRTAIPATTSSDDARLGAQVVAVVRPADASFTSTSSSSLFTTALQPERDPHGDSAFPSASRSGGAYVKLERKVGDYATAAAAAQVTLGTNGVFDRVGLALTTSAPRRSGRRRRKTR